MPSILMPPIFGATSSMFFARPALYVVFELKMCSVLQPSSLAAVTSAADWIVSFGTTRA